MDGEPLTPRQQEVLDVLRAPGVQRPTWPASYGASIRDRLEDELGPVAGLLDQPLFVNKATLHQVLSCEAHWVAAEAEPFEWTVANARGQIVHHAVEQSLHRRDRPSPWEAVDRSLEQLAGGSTELGSWLASIDEGDRAALRATAADQVTSFFELWPPLDPRWHPRTETKLRADLAGGMVVVSGRPDVTLGRADGLQSGKVVVDLKTGATRSSHIDELRLCALLETLRTGVPPFRVATHHLDTGTLDAHPIDDASLVSAARRLVEGVHRMVEVRTGQRSPTVTPGPQCAWCPLRADCPEAPRS